MSTHTRVELHKRLERLELEELRTLCFCLEVDYDDLRGEGKSARARELLLLLERREQLVRLINLLDQPDSTPIHIETRYTEYLRHQYGRVPLGGIAPRLQDRVLNIPLEELFVPTYAEEDAPLQAHFITGAYGLQAQRTTGSHTVDLEEMLTRSLVDLEEMLTHPRVLLLGEPGAGKSTILRWLVNRLLKTKYTFEPVNKASASLPVLIRLVNFAAVLAVHPGLTVAEYIRKWHLPDYQRFFERLLMERHGWLLLDGLDEVSDARLRRQIRDAVQSFAVQYSDFHVIITSRIVGYRNAQFHNDFRHFTLQPFGPDEIAQFIHNWYRTVERQVKGGAKDGEAHRRAERLWEGIKEKPRVLSLAGNPLLLAIIALMDWKNKEIPKRRVELYQVAIQTLLEDWPAEQWRPTTENLRLTEMLDVLALVAYQLFAAGFHEAIRVDELETRMAELIEQVRNCSPAQARELTHRWLPILSEHSGLLLDAGVDEYLHPVYTFLHLSFVEYLSGRALVKLWREQQADLTPYTNDPRWREVVLLMAGEIGMQSTADATRLVNEICQLKPPHHDILHQSLVLAAACLADDVPVEPNLRNEILDQLVTLWHTQAQGLLRSKLFRIFAAMRNTDSTPALLKRLMPLLSDQREWVRSSVLELFGKFDQPINSMLKAQLLTALQDENSKVQHATVRSLETLALAHDLEVRSALVEVLHHAGDAVRTRAALALSPIVDQDPSVRFALLQTLATDSNPEPRRMATRALGAIKRPDRELFEQMFAALRDANGSVRKEAATNFGHWGEAGRQFLVTELHQVLQSHSSEIRREFVYIVADIHPIFEREATELLLELAQSEQEPAVRARLIRAFGQLRTTDPRIIEELVKALTDKNRAMQRFAAQALKRFSIRDRQISLGLIQLLKADDVTVRQYAAEALVTCGMPEPEVVQTLEDTLGDPHELMRFFAAEALVEIDAPSPSVHEILCASLRSENGEIRRRSAQELRRAVHLLDTSVIDVLTEIVQKDSNREVREQAVKTLAGLGHQVQAGSITALRVALHDDYTQVRVNAVEALGNWGEHEVTILDDLLTALADPDARVRLAASDALITLGEGAERDRIISRIRELLDAQPAYDDVQSTLWGVIVGE